MLTEVRNAVVVGPTSRRRAHGEIPVLADGGAGASVRGRAAARLRPQRRARGDFNPERITLNDARSGGTSCRSPTSATASPAPVVGGGRLQLRQLQVPRAQRPAARRRQAEARGHATEEARRARDRRLQRREPRRPRSAGPSSTALAAQIVGNLRSPDILSLEEIQDNDGAAERGADGRERHVHAPAGGDRRRPAARPTTTARSTRSTPGRRRAGRQHPRRVPVPHRQPRPRSSSTGRAGRPTTTGDRAGGRPAPVIQPGARRSRPTRCGTTAASRWRPSSATAASRCS